MKARVITLCLASLFVLALLFTAAAPGVPATPAPSPVPAAAPESHPQIRAAIDALRRARGHLQEAKHDFGGHRDEAIRATDHAIEQLEICLKY
jgi:hypothetical protein